MHESEKIFHIRPTLNDRPKEADGTRYGDWETDLIVDRHSNAILTLVERSTNYMMAEKLKEGKKAKPLAKVVWRLPAPFKGFALKAIATDNGGEFAEHERISRHPGVTVYFADSYCSWQKGAVENANKLLRQYMPEGTDIGRLSDRHVKNSCKDQAQTQGKT